MNPAIVERVLTTMDELGFVRNNLASQVRMGRRTMLGMIVLKFADFGDLARACEEAAEGLGDTVILGSDTGVSVGVGVSNDIGHLVVRPLIATGRSCTGDRGRSPAGAD